MKNRSLQGLLAVALWVAAAAPAWAQIKIGQTSSFTGPVASGVKEGTDGARLYLSAINERGGVNGQQIELISLDDKFDAKLAAENAQKLISQGAVALFFSRGTPQAQAIMPVLDKNKVPLIGPSTGAMVLHKPVHPWVFNVRATYQKEAERAVRHLNLTGMTRIALLHSSDSFGEDGAAGALKGFELDNAPSPCCTRSTTVPSPTSRRSSPSSSSPRPRPSSSSARARMCRTASPPCARRAPRRRS
jgi:branched-chain amino acid transport system substrate-binding protein